MGLFDKFKKKKPDEVEYAVDVEETKVEVSEEEEAPAETEVKQEEALPVQGETDEAEAPKEEENRRFTMMVENAYQLEEDNGVVVVGDLFGKIKNGDTIYVLFPNNRMIITTVEEMEVGPGRRVEEAENEKLALRINEIKKRENMPPFTIITNIVPNPDAKEGTELENPLLLGLSMEYPKHGQEAAYNNLLIFMLCHTRYVVPASIEKKESDSAESPQIRFPSLVDPNDSNNHVLPVFTDWKALANWKDIFDEKHPAQSVIMTFQEAISVCKGRGIVMNPFGPMTIVLSANNIQQIVNMENYKKEFGDGKEEKASAPKTQQQQPPQMMVGVPKDNPEVMAVKTAIVEYAKQDNQVKRVDLLIKMDLQQERAFICVVDCPKEQTSRVFAAIQKAASAHLNEVKRIDFLQYGASKLANDLVSDKSCIYQE